MATAVDVHFQVDGLTAVFGTNVNPAWLDALTLGTWAQIGSNTIQDVNPAQDAAINPLGGGTNNAPWTPAGNLTNACNEWSGGALDELHKRFHIQAGGHSGYYGNEGYFQDLTQDTAPWARNGYPSGSIQKPNPGGFTSNGANASLLPDQRPQAVHTYNLLVTDDPTGDLIMLPGGFQWASVASPFGYPRRQATGEWDTSVPFPIVSSANSSCGARDPVSGRIFAFMAGTICSYHPTTGAKTDHFNTGGAWVGYYCHMEYDSTRQLMVVFSGGQQSGAYLNCKIAYFDPANPTAFTIATVTGGSTTWGTRGIIYDADGDRYLLWDGGSDFAVVTPPATNPGSNAWVTSTLTCSGTPTTKSANGTWGRMRYSPGYKTVLLLNSTTQRTWAIKLH